VCELLHNPGLSYQRAKFVSDHLDEEARRKWLEEVWPQILRLAWKERVLVEEYAATGHNNQHFPKLEDLASSVEEALAYFAGLPGEIKNLMRLYVESLAALPVAA